MADTPDTRAEPPPPARESFGGRPDVLRKALDHIPVMVSVRNHEGRHIFVNCEWERVLGYSLEEFQALCDAGEDGLARFFPDPAELARARAFAATMGEWAHFRPVTREGRTLDTLWFKVRLEDGTIISLGQDVTARMCLEEELRQAQRLEAVGRLAGGVAHDFNNLLTALLGFADLAERHARGNPQLERCMTEIRRAGERAAVLTEQLLSFGGHQAVKPRVHDLAALVRAFSGDLERVIGEEIALHTSHVGGPALVTIDEGRFEQILMNLAVNAREAMPKGGDLRIEVRGPSATGEPSRVEVEVRDSGVGMSPEVRSRVFDPFYTTKPDDLGTGLGLSTVYGAVRGAGGYIVVKSAPGRGTEFRISFPEAPAIRGIEPTDALGDAPGGTERILVVDDDMRVRELTAEILTRAGYRVLPVDGRVAAERVFRENGSFDLVVCDVVMPGDNGWEVRRRLSAMADGLPFLFISGFPADDMARRGIEQKRLEFLPKPFRREELLRRVRAALDGARIAGS